MGSWIAMCKQCSTQSATGAVVCDLVSMIKGHWNFGRGFGRDLQWITMLRKRYWVPV